MIAVGSPVPEAEVYDGRGAAPLPVFFAGTALLVFFRSESDPCRRLLSNIGELRLFEPGVPVIGVSQETIEATAELLQELGIGLPVVIDDRPFPASAAFDFGSLPAFALIEDDRVRFVSEGLGPDLGRLLAELTTITGQAAAPDGVLEELEGASPSRAFD